MPDDLSKETEEDFGDRELTEEEEALLKQALDNLKLYIEDNTEHYA